MKTTSGCVVNGDQKSDDFTSAQSSWSLLKLNPMKQRKYVDELKEYLPEVESYYPVYSKLTRPHGSRRPIQVSRPVYPGYLFLMVGNVSMSLPVSLPVSARWVRFGGVVEAVPSRVIEILRRMEKNNELVREIVHVNPYYPGARVRVLLPMSDLAAVIVKLVGRNRALVDMPLGMATVPIHRLQVL